MEFYNQNIQLDKNVIHDIFKQFQSNTNTKMLVFGLGYDSRMWYNGNKNTYFVEDNNEYIQLNHNYIPKENIIQYNYQNITVEKSFQMNDKELFDYKVPDKLLELAPFDIILIDGPEGYNPQKPGRLIPCYWTDRFLSKKGTIIYIDDSVRKLENYCINRFFQKKEKRILKKREWCTKIIY